MAIPWDDMWPEIQEEWRRTRGNVQMSPTAHAEFKRLLDELEEEGKRRELATALEAGFSSVEEHEEALHKEYRERELEARKRVEEETGKTWDEYWATHPQRQKTPEEHFPHCDCHDHPIPMFCAKSLVDYKTQDAPDLVDFFQVKGDQDIRDLKFDPNDKSKRLSSEMLEHHWEKHTQEASSEWPPWLKGDSVLRRIEQQDNHGDYQEQLETLMETRAKNDTPSSIFTEDRSDVEMFNATSPSTPTSASFSGENSLIKDRNEPEIEERSADNYSVPSDKPNYIQTTPQKPKLRPKTTNTGQSQLTRPSGVSKNTTAAKRQRRKSVMETTRRTCSQNFTKFYELDADGTSRTYRRYG